MTKIFVSSDKAFDDKLKKFMDSDEEFGFLSQSALFRLVVTRFINHPKAFFGPGGNTNEIPDELIDSINEIRIQLKIISQQIADKPKPEGMTKDDYELEQLLKELNENPRLKECDTLEKLEDLYPSRYWRAYTEHVVAAFVKLNMLINLGDRLQWL